MGYPRGIPASLPGPANPEALLSWVAGAIAYVRVGFTEADWAAIPPANTGCR